MSDDLPPLEDFQNELKTITKNKPNQSKSEQDYTKMNLHHIEDSQKQKQELNRVKKDIAKIDKNIQLKDSEREKKAGYGGLKKGFLSSGNNTKKGFLPSQVEPTKSSTKITEVKANKNADPLRIPEVQQAMKMNNYLDSTRKDWMTEKFLQNVTSNEKIGKLFSNPEYVKAIDLFKTNPKEAMMKYGNNKEFMDGFQEFCQMMGMQFQNLANKDKASK